MKVLVSGMGRSGTMLLYKMTGSLPRVISKHNHYPDEGLRNWADIILTTKRDFREMMASTKRFLGGHYTWKEINVIYNNVTEECQMSINIFQYWKDYAKRIMVLEDWFVDPEKYFKQVLESLEIQMSEDEIKKKVAQFQKPVANNHITRNQNQLINYHTLTESEIQEYLTLISYQTPY